MYTGENSVGLIIKLLVLFGFGDCFTFSLLILVCHRF